MTRLAFIALFVLVGYFLFRWAFGSSAPRGSGAAETEMVQDPNCQMFIPKNEAVYKIMQGQGHYFCTDKCADEYLEKHRPG